MRKMERDQFEALLFANRHNFLGYSKTERMIDEYNAVKPEIEQAFESTSEWLTAPVVVSAKNNRGEL